jgi:hypothetical protein
MSASLSSVTGWEQVLGRDELLTHLTLDYSLPPCLISFKRFSPIHSISKFSIEIWKHYHGECPKMFKVLLMQIPLLSP